MENDYFSGFLLTVAIGLFSALVFALIFFIYGGLFGIHMMTGTGSHVGYVTATEKGGIFFVTSTAYIKTDVQSSQEDSYCVMDDGVFKDLQQASVKKEKVEVKYHSFLFSGISNCNGESAIIDAVVALN